MMEEPRQRTKKNTIFWTAVEGECFECSEPADHLHHVVPFSAGGTRCVPLCEPCHAKASYVKKLGTGEDVKKGQQRAKAKGKRSAGRKSQQPPALIALIEEMYKDGLSLSSISRLLIKDGTWPMPDGYQGEWKIDRRNKTGKQWLSPETRWYGRMYHRTERCLQAGATERELLVNERTYQLQQLLGDDAPPAVSLPPVYKNQNLPSLFTLDGDINPDAVAE